MSVLYFNNAVNTSYETLGNWWSNSTFTTQASSLPTNADDCIVNGSVTGTDSLTCNTINFNNTSKNLGSVNGKAIFQTYYSYNNSKGFFKTISLSIPIIGATLL